MSIALRAALCGVLLSGGAIVGTTAAHAASVSLSGGVLVYQAAPGESNDAKIQRSFLDDEFVVTEDTGSSATLTAGTGCTTSAYVSRTVYCPSTGIGRVRFVLGDGDDAFLGDSSVAPAVTEVHTGDGAFHSITSESAARTEVTGGNGTDYVTTFDGDDVVTTGAGPDVVRTNSGHDEVDAGAGDDDVRGGPGADDIQGGDGNDLVYGDPGMDTLRGGPGGDRLYGEQDADDLFGDDGDDLLHDDGSFEQGFASGDQLHGGTGRDTADYNSRGGTLPVTITLDEAANDGSAEEADNVGPAGDVEIVIGSNNDDVLVGSDRPDELHGGYGRDRMDGRGGPDLLDGFAGNDQLAGGEGADELIGSADNDGLLGEGGDDVLAGGTGDDAIGGGSGADLLDGGLDSDTLLARDGVVDQIRCSMGRDAVESDAGDSFLDAPQCEAVNGIATVAPPPAVPEMTTVVVSPKPGTLAVTLVQVPRLGTVLRTGLPVRVRPDRTGRLSIRLTVPRTVARRLGLAAASGPVVVGRATRSVRAGQPVNLKVRLTARARKRLRRARRVAVTVRAQVRATDGATTTSSRTVTLRR